MHSELEFIKPPLLEKKKKLRIHTRGPQLITYINEMSNNWRNFPILILYSNFLGTITFSPIYFNE